MKIDICLTATDMKEIYINQIPNFIKVWKMFGIEPRIILINHEIPIKFKEYSEYIILFDPLKYNLNTLQTAYIAQNIRILYPALLSSSNNNGETINNKSIIISDIDIMPISRSFFIDTIKNISDDCFVNYRRYNKQLNICYNVALSSTWSAIFKIDCMDDLVMNLMNNYNNNYNSNKNCPGWFSDQEFLTQKVTEYEKLNPTKIIFLDKFNIKIKRLDKRDRKEILMNRKDIIKNIGNYTDFHITSKNQRYIKLSEEINSAIFKYLSLNK